MEASQNQPEPHSADEPTGSPPGLSEREQDAGSTPVPGSPAAADQAASPDSFAERPELYVGAAFAGGLVLAGLVRILSR